MERGTKHRASNVCMVIFALCLSVRVVEYFLIRTDQTALGENVLHKAAGILILALALKKLELSWSEIGFQREGFVSGISKGLLLGGICFALSFGAELAILALQGDPAHLELYISGFSLTGSQTKHRELLFFLLCLLFNIVNVWMEEGVFRGLFIKILSGAKPFRQANLMAAALFSIWHIVMPVRSYVNGEMSFGTMVLMGIGYIVLAGLMAVKWGLLYHMTGSLWVGLGDHLFNNTVATNMLHVISQTGADELQILRIMVAQMLSLAFVLAIHCNRTRRENG